MLSTGQLLGDYRIVRPLGNGNMGQVYLAYDLKLDRQVALKLVREDRLLDATLQERFLREMQETARLKHPHILTILTIEQQMVQNMPLRFMVMEYERDGSLEDWLAKRSQRRAGLPAPEDVASIVQQAANALQYAHDRKIIHRDVKPSNFLITNLENINRPEIKLADFGLVKVLTDGKLTSTGLGTPYYMAPEVDSDQPTPSIDQYALGIMTYELLAGRVPFQGDRMQVLIQHYREIPQPPSKYNLLISKQTDAVVLKALAKKPEQRYPSVKAFADAFQDSVQPKTPSKPRRNEQPVNRRQSGTVSTFPPLVRPRGENLATLTLTPKEASTGSMKQLTVMDGLEQKMVRLRVPNSLSDGQTLRFVVPSKLDNGHTLHQEEQYNGSDPITRSLIVTVNVTPEKQEGGKAGLIIGFIILALLIAALIYALTMHIIVL